MNVRTVQHELYQRILGAVFDLYMSCDNVEQLSDKTKRGYRVLWSGSVYEEKKFQNKFHLNTGDHSYYTFSIPDACLCSVPITS